MPKGGTRPLTPANACEENQKPNYWNNSINWQGHIRFWRAEKRSCRFKALGNTQSITCGLFIAWPLFCSGKTACTWQLWIFEWFLSFEMLMCRNPSKLKGQKAPERHAVRRVCSCYLMVLYHLSAKGSSKSYLYITPVVLPICKHCARTIDIVCLNS